MVLATAESTSAAADRPDMGTDGRDGVVMLGAPAGPTGEGVPAVVTATV